jgi:hypothetical protein
MRLPELTLGTPPFSPLEVEVKLIGQRITTPGQVSEAIDFSSPFEIPHRKVARVLKLVDQALREE